MNGFPMDPKQQRRESVAASKRQLQDELRKILEQKAAVERQLEMLRARGVPIPAAPASGALARAGSASLHASPSLAGKRPAPAAATPLDHPNKRQRILDLRRTRVREIFKACKGIVSQLKKNASATPFLQPVDPVKSGATDYYRLITQPMDMSTVLKKLEGQYTSPLEFAVDMRLIWRNCATYNAAGTPVATMGAKMEAAWEQKWQLSGIEQKWAEEMAVQQRENEVRRRRRKPAAAGSAACRAPQPQRHRRCRRRGAAARRRWAPPAWARGPPGRPAAPASGTPPRRAARARRARPAPSPAPLGPPGAARPADRPSCPSAPAPPGAGGEAHRHLCRAVAAAGDAAGDQPGGQQGAQGRQAAAAAGRAGRAADDLRGEAPPELRAGAAVGCAARRGAARGWPAPACCCWGRWELRRAAEPLRGAAGRGVPGAPARS
jgi:hypothetical protein